MNRFLHISLVENKDMILISYLRINMLKLDFLSLMIELFNYLINNSSKKTEFYC